MSGIIKNALRFSLLRPVTETLKSSNISRFNHQLSRNIWRLSSNENFRLHHPKNIRTVNGCNCNISCLHTKTEKELAVFLNEEIAAERKLQKNRNLPTEIDGFKVKLEGSDVTLTKQEGSEEIEVSFNINHSTVDSSEGDQNLEAEEMHSKPNFEVEIRRNDKTLGFTCSMLSPSSSKSDSGYDDLFVIDEVVFYTGEWKETNYAVAGDILDGELYDMLMNLLDEKGVGNQLIEKIVQFSTAYEHSRYIDMLEDVQKFCSSK